MLDAPYVEYRWRVYVVTGNDFDIYAYTVIGCRGEKEAIDIIRTVITPGSRGLRVKLVSIPESELTDEGEG